MSISDIVFFGFLGTTEIIVVAVVILVLFGAAKIPQFMRSLGQGMNEFKKASRGDDDEGESDKKASANSNKDEDKKSG